METLRYHTRVTPITSSLFYLYINGANLIFKPLQIAVCVFVGALFSETLRPLLTGTSPTWELLGDITNS